MTDSMIERAKVALRPLVDDELRALDGTRHEMLVAQCVRAAIEAMRAEVAKYDGQITGEHADGSYYSVEEAVFDEGRESALADILAMISAALSEKP